MSQKVKKKDQSYFPLAQVGHLGRIPHGVDAQKSEPEPEGMAVAGSE